MMDARVKDLMIAIQAWREDSPDYRHACEEVDSLAKQVYEVIGVSEPDSTLGPKMRMLALYYIVDDAMDAAEE